jgi:hypothetical protein
MKYKVNESEQNMKYQLSKIQNDITQLYFETFKKYDGGLGLSIPHIPRISMNYLINRTIVVGQETNTWYGDGLNGEDKLKDLFDNHAGEIEKYCLDEAYDTFIQKEADCYGGNFWNFNRLLYTEKILDGKMVNDVNTLSHCWINLFAVEACKNKKDEWGRPTVNRPLAAKVLEMQDDLLHKVFEILQPKCIIFLTGHSNDYALFRTAITTKYDKKAIDSNGVLNDCELAQIIVNDPDNVLHNTKIARTYHPSYFLGRINVYKNLRERKKAQGISISNSEYYKKVLFDFLNPHVSE